VVSLTGGMHDLGLEDQLCGKAVRFFSADDHTKVMFTLYIGSFCVRRKNYAG
jgi:hypothetical protein